jgi:ATP-dependent Clp protease protease subunit
MPFNMINKGDKTGEINIYGAIGNSKWNEEDTTPTDFKRQLDALGDVEFLNVFINSPGGGIYAGITIYDILKNHPAAVKTIGQGIVASIATVIFQAGDERVMIKNGTMYLHNPMGCMCGYATEMRKYADLLDKAKVPILKSFDNIKISETRLAQLMDEETTLNASEVVKMGLADYIEDRKVKASVKNCIVSFNNVEFNSDIFKNFDLSKIELFDGEKTEPIQMVKNDSEVAAEMERRYHLMNELNGEIANIEISTI